MVSVTPDLRLPFQPQGSTASWPIPNYTAWLTDVHVCEQLAQGYYLKVQGRESNPRPSESPVQRPNHYATKPYSGHSYIIFSSKHKHVYHATKLIILGAMFFKQARSNLIVDVHVRNSLRDFEENFKTNINTTVNNN